MWLCSFAFHLFPIGKHPSVAPQPNALASVYIVRHILGRWMSLQVLEMCWSHQCSSWTPKELSLSSVGLKFSWWSFNALVFLFLSFYNAACLHEQVTDANCLVVGFLWSKNFLIFFDNYLTLFRVCVSSHVCRVYNKP